MKERVYTKADLEAKLSDAELWRRAAESELDEIEGWLKIRHPALSKQYWRDRGAPVSITAFGGTSQPIRPEERAGMGETTPTKVQRPDSVTGASSELTARQRKQQAQDKRRTWQDLMRRGQWSQLAREDSEMAQ